MHAIEGSEDLILEDISQWTAAQVLNDLSQHGLPIL